ncbi:MAG TPA: cytochrome c [Actinobacteria bacterium]|nr:cytochrome c [Actinomycetota bacterium]
MEALIQQVSEAAGIPPDLVERSARARAQAEGRPVEEVLARWAGEETPGGEPPPPPEAAPAPAPAPAAPVAMTKEELVAKAAEAKGMPENLVERSAAARAKKEGVSVEQVLAEWAGVDLPAEGAAPAAGPAPPAAATPTEAPAEGEAETLEVEVLEPAAEAVVEETEEAPRRPSRYPAALVTLLVVVPLLAVAYLATFPNGPACGSAGRLEVHPVTGEAVGCDLEPYGEGGSDAFTLGAAIYEAQCVACHGANGEGGVGPAFANGAVLETFPAGSCADHVRWVELGSNGWPDPTYGATAKPVGGAGVPMPGFASLSEAELAQVVLYERVAFGGQDLADAEKDCGLAAEGE